MKQIAEEFALQTNRTIVGRQGRMTENEIAEIIIGCAIKVHKVLGPGLAKSAYEECMGYLLGNTVLEVERRKQLAFVQKDENPDACYRHDFLANKKVILDIKSVVVLDDIDIAKINTCLRRSGCKAGLLINFNVEHLADGIERVGNYE
jgi:GxxExxY protein